MVNDFKYEGRLLAAGFEKIGKGVIETRSTISIEGRDISSMRPFYHRVMLRPDDSFEHECVCPTTRGEPKLMRIPESALALSGSIDLDLSTCKIWNLEKVIDIIAPEKKK